MGILTQREEIKLNQSNKKEALLIRHRKNYLDIELEQSFSYGLNTSGFNTKVVDIDELAKIIDDFNIEKYDMIAFDVQYNSMFSSKRKRAYLFEEIFRRAKEGALTMYDCDIQLGLQPWLWDEGEPHETRKRNVFNSRPVKVLASFSPEIINDTKALERVNTVWMNNKLHPDSKIHFIEWISFAVYTYGKNIPNDEKEFTGEPIRNFYYGMDRGHIGRSLIRCGMEGEEDLVYGSIARTLKDDKIRTIDESVKKPFSWIKYLEHSENVIFPYEPIKSDYQITVRLLEALLFYKDKVVFDDRVNPELIKYTKDIDAWETKAKETADKIKKLYS